MRLTKLFNEFFESEKGGGLALILCTIVSLILANSAFQAFYNGFWNTDFAGHPIYHWVNDGLMTLFFLLIGLELEREIYIGELSDIKNAILPVIAAIGGMVVPAGFHFFFNAGTSTQAGAGIPTATDIAFAIGILSLLGNRVPAVLKIFLTALAVIDDLGAIIVISIFYSGAISLLYLGIALGIFGVLLALNRLKVHNLIPYLIGGVFMWYFMLHSGIHATITGVLLAFAIPFGNGGERSPSYILQHHMHFPVTFVILPIFALANTSITLPESWITTLVTPNNMGIFTGLVLGKPIGILLFSMLAVLFGLAALPKEIKFKHIAGVGFLGGIGFTMSIFITLLAFEQPELIAASKITIMISSLIAALTGLLWLQLTLKAKKKPVKASH